MKKQKVFAFWAINDSLVEETAMADLQLFARCGFDGVVFQPRNYPGKPDYLSKEYFEIVSMLIIYCKTLKLEFWIYDENGWPSGTADGKVLQQNPYLIQEWLELEYPTNNDSDFEELSKKTVRWKKVKKSGPSPLDAKATLSFIQIVYEGYKEGLSQEAFEYVTGFFSDETAMPLNKEQPSIPWGEHVKDLYQEKTSRELTKDFSALFFDDVFAVEITEQIRITFWESCATLLTKNYYELLSNWCQKNGKRFTAHLRGEENIALGIPFSGSTYQVLRSIDTPMIDVLERKRSNPLLPRLASSVAAQFHDGNSFCEAMGGAGWGIEPQDVIQMGNWLASADVNLICLHLSQYKLNAKAIRDWPPSIPKHLNWLPLFSTMLASLKATEWRSSPKEETLFVLPVRKVMANYHAWELSLTNRHKGASQPKTNATRLSLQVNRELKQLVSNCEKVHVVDEKTFEEEGKIEKGQLRIGNCSYSQVVASEECYFFQQGQELLAQWSTKQIKNHSDDGEAKNAIKAMKNLTTATETIRQENWQMGEVVTNLLPFGENYFREGVLKKYINFEDKMDSFLVTSDEIDYLTVNQQKINSKAIIVDDFYSYPIPSACLLEGVNSFEVYAKAQEKQPLCWLAGKFAVTILRSHRGNNCSIADEVAISKLNIVQLSAQRLSYTGLPFVAESLHLKKQFFIERECSNWMLDFDLFEAAGAKVILDGRQLSFIWRNQKRKMVKEMLTVGTHLIEVELYPSTFNKFGPFRYKGGDSPLISPFQYQQMKNMMDNPTLPPIIEHDGLNFKKLGIGNLVIKTEQETK
jgi:hypothetical protein